MSALEDEPVTAAALAGWIGISPNRIHALARDGVLPRDDLNGFPLRAAVAAYCEWSRTSPAGRPVATSDLAAEKLRLTRAQADRVEQQAARERGDLLPADAVTRAWTTTVAGLRAALLAVPARVAAQLGLDRAIAAAIDAELRTALEEIADAR